MLEHCRLLRDLKSFQHNMPESPVVFYFGRHDLVAKPEHRALAGTVIGMNRGGEIAEPHAPQLFFRGGHQPVL